MTMNLLPLKLHRQFAHPSADKLKKLLKDANKCDPDLLRTVDKVTEKCNTCIKYKRQRPRPVVSLSLEDKFNQTVAMDLKIYGKDIYFFVMVDISTRYCSAAVIHDKKPNMIITALFTNWISRFGAPRQVLSDNGGEFSNESMRCLADSFGIKLVATAGRESLEQWRV